MFFVIKMAYFALFCNFFLPRFAHFKKKQKALVPRKNRLKTAFEKEQHGGLSSVGRASDCGSECRGFEPHIPPQILKNQQVTLKT